MSEDVVNATTAVGDEEGILNQFNPFILQVVSGQDSPNRRNRPRHRRINDEDEEEAYSEGEEATNPAVVRDASEEDEDVYSEDDEEESEEEYSAESSESETDDFSEEEEWDERRQMYRAAAKKHSSPYRQQSSSSAGANIRPRFEQLINGMSFAGNATNPLFQPTTKGPANLPPLLAATLPIVAQTIRQVQMSQPVGPDGKIVELTPAQLQEIARNTISTLASQGQPGAVAMMAAAAAAQGPAKKLPILLPRDMPEEASANGGTNVSMMSRMALLQRLGANQQQHQQMLLQQQSMSPLSLARGALKVPKRGRGRPRKRPQPSDLGLTSEELASPIAARRSRREKTGRIDYSRYFGKRASGQGEDEDDEDNEEDAGQNDPTPRDSTPGRKRGRRPKAKPMETDSEFLQSEEEGGNYPSMSASMDEPTVEKILSWRRNPETGEEEFFVKFHSLSYLHADWIGSEEMKAASNGASRIKRFLGKPLSQRHWSDREIFNPDWIRPERIIYGWEHPDPEIEHQMNRSYLVKWTGLPYEEATWEKAASIESLPEGPERIREYEGRPSLADRLDPNNLRVGHRAREAPKAAEEENEPITEDCLVWRPLKESLVYKGDNQLRSYQLEGLNWLVHCWIHRQSCIIADEMGLGKTVQSVAFLNLLWQQFRLKGPFLIVAPLSTLPHWEREFQGWTDLNVLVYHGSVGSRDLMYEYEFFYRRSEADERPVRAPDGTVPLRFDVLITTYEMALAGFDHLESIVWRVAIFDEAHRLKNRASKAAEVLRSFQIEHKVLLTGTPLQNNLEELFALLSFLQPNRFTSEEDFLAEYGQLQRSEDVAKLQALLRPLMLRRLKEDVEKSIPVKEETIIEVELTALQKRYYRAILEKNFAMLTKGATGGNAPNLLNTMMELRKCCIHPFLLKGAEERILQECNATSVEAQHQVLVQASGKLVLLDKLLARLWEQGHRVLIFSQMTRCLDLLSDYLRWRSYPHERIDGAIKGELRQAAIDRFCAADSDSFVFLLCTRAGGVGINLTAADTVVIFDSDWNPQNDIQAQARCHRIGQSKAVKVYRLITRNTYEREMFDRAGMKLGLDRAILQKMVGPDSEAVADADPSLLDTHGPQLSKGEVETLLKRGAYGLLMDNDEDAIKFCAEDIDQILERRTQVITHGGSTQKESSIFSKASFAAATTADEFDLDLDDPNFWEAWARRLDMDPRQLLANSGVSVDEPRIRRQIRRLKSEVLDIGPVDGEISLPITKPDNKSLVGSEPILWTDEERRRFVKLLLVYGLHRIDPVFLEQHPSRTRNDLIACTRALVRFCIDHHGVRDDTKFREDQEKLLLAHLDFDRNSLEIADGTVVDAATGKIDLVAAEMVVEDPDRLGLPRPLSATSAESGKESMAAPSGRNWAKSDIPYPGASERQILEFRSFLKEAPESFTNGILMYHSKIILLRLQLLDFLRSLVQGDEGSVSNIDNAAKTLTVPNVTGPSPTEWWGREEDRALLIGAYRIGYGEWSRMKAEIFVPLLAEHPERLEEPNWPTEDVLEGRLRKLILSIEKRSQAAAKLAVHAMNHPLGGRRRRPAGEDDDYEEAGGHFVQQPLVRWTKKDRFEFIRVVSNYGLPLAVEGRDWSVFCQLGDFSLTVLRALPHAFDQFTEVFEQACRDAVDGNVVVKPASTPKGRRSPGKATKRNKKSRLEDEDEEYGDFDQNEDDEEFDDFDEPQDNTRSRRGTPKRKKLATEPPAPLVIPADRARRLQAKISMFERLRGGLCPREDLPDLLYRARRSGGLPKWWETSLHDVPFLRAIAKYGFGRADLVVADEEFPFLALYQERKPEEETASSESTSKALVDEKSEEEVIIKSPSAPRRSGRSASLRSRKSEAAEVVSSDPKIIQQILPPHKLLPLDLASTINPAIIGWPVESIILRRVEYLMDLGEAEMSRRLAEGHETEDAGKQGGGKKTAKGASSSGKKKTKKKKVGEEDASDALPDSSSFGIDDSEVAVESNTSSHQGGTPLTGKFKLTLGSRSSEAEAVEPALKAFGEVGGGGNKKQRTLFESSTIKFRKTEFHNFNPKAP